MKRWSMGGLAVALVAAGLAAPRVLNMTDRGEVRFFEDSANGANEITVRAPASVAADYELVLPTDDGGSGEFLTTDGSGVLSWGNSSAATLDSAYDNGDTVTVDSSALTLNGSISGNTLDVDQTGTGDAISVTNSGGGHALHVDTGTVQVDESLYVAGGEPWFDVKAYGATGDGVTDDTTAVANAYAALDAAGGGVLFLPPGSYLITTVLSISSDDVTLQGSGANGSEIITDGNDAIDVGDGATSTFCDNFVMRDLRLRETDAADTTSIGIEFNTYLRYGRIERCRIQSFGGGGILMHGGLNNRIDQCYVACSKAGTTGPNLYVTRSAEDTSFTTLLTQNNYFASMGNASVYSVLIEDGSNWTSVLDIWEGSAGVALRVQQSAADPTIACGDHHVLGGHWESNSGNDIEISDVARFVKVGGFGGTVVDTWSALSAANQYFYENNGATGLVDGLRKLVIANAFNAEDISSTAGLQLGGIDGNELPEMIMATESDTSGRTQRIRYFAETSGGSNVEIGRTSVIQGAADATAPVATYQVSLTPSGGSIAAILEVSGTVGKTALSLPQTGTNNGLTVGADTNLYRSAANTWTTDDSLSVTGTTTALGPLVGDTFVRMTSSTVTIATGVATITRSNHSIDTESAAASDDLDTITMSGGNVNGTIITLRAASDARTVVVRDNQGNIQTAGSANFSMDNSLDRIVLQYVSANSVWVEICRANNGT